MITAEQERRLIGNLWKRKDFIVSAMLRRRPSLKLTDKSPLGKATFINNYRQLSWPAKLTCAISDYFACRDKLIMAHMPLAKKMSRRYVLDSYQEVAQEAALGMVTAVDRFDKKQKVRLTTYAQWWILKYCQNFKASRMSMVFSTTLYNSRQIRQMLAAIQMLLHENERFPSEEQIAERMKVGVEAVHHLLIATKSFSDDYNDAAEKPKEQVDPNVPSIVSSLLKTLSKVEKSVVSGLFGIGKDYMKYRELAKELHISHGSINRIKHEAIESMSKVARAAGMTFETVFN